MSVRRISKKTTKSVKATSTDSPPKTNGTSTTSSTPAAASTKPTTATTPRRVEKNPPREPTGFEKEFPPEEGPPPLSWHPGASEAALADGEPEYAVYLDQGAFRAVWELLEAEAKYRYPTHTSMNATRAYLRGVRAFRAARRATERRIEEATERVQAAPVRKVKRVVKKR